ncbi:MAG: ATP-grasp domain-containing protein [Chloroflexi bacterium]|nr:ATP-grasp domain-containing protein [Chloroflexota bacterium]MBM4450281.1 ATP-grasp domain-containing protein [Chloroflexota bacterium]MBM4453108.1 ATP-grasp domain-containing protein [Chloroflexota bacterium]
MKSILVANRGEIARRIVRTAKRLGIETIAIHSDADETALFVQEADKAIKISGNRPRDSYLNMDHIVSIAKELKIDAIHPGYGFLAERWEFAQKCEQEGVTFIGPKSAVIHTMGDKARSREIATSIGIPIPPGSEILRNTGEAKEWAEKLAFPVIFKASAGGGGIGMKRVEKVEDVEEAFEEASNRARMAFGDDRVYIEKYMDSPHHIEIQILGDEKGEVVTFPERECSVQRRHQKVIEESPSPFATPELRQSLRQSAKKLAEKLGYTNAGTVEFVVDRNRNFYFLEVNTRLQVEHPITEMITGFDLVEQQVRIASGEPLTIDEARIAWKGWALEARIYAEDSENFYPSPGKLTSYVEPGGDGIRVDSGYKTGDTISQFYDPLVAKLITWGEDRDKANSKMLQALATYEITGIKNNIPFLKQAFDSALFKTGNYDTHFISKLKEKSNG